MDRNLDGIFFRVERDGKWKDICLSDLTDDEAKEVLSRFDKEALLKTVIVLKNTIHQIGDDLDLEGIR